jgi:hypothetical protein
MQTVANFVQAVNDAIINPILGVLFAGALLLFLFGAAKLVLQAGDDSKRNEGKQHMLWGIVGMVIMVSVFAILKVALFTFGVGPADIPTETPLF